MTKYKVTIPETRRNQMLLLEFYLTDENGKTIAENALHYYNMGLHQCNINSPPLKRMPKGVKYNKVK